MSVERIGIIGPADASRDDTGQVAAKAASVRFER
jgi:hypothetical protein